MSLVGRTIGKYEIVDVIGRGGMAAIYLGYQQDLDRKVAVKVLPPHPGLDAQFIERFQLEARTVAKLQHPHILPLYDFGAEGDVLYLITPYVDGGSLDKLMDDGRLDTLFTERIMREIASALDYAHRRGVIHRDIKPANILLDSDSHALLADFGIAKMAGSSANLTGTGVVGTPAYMSPEQSQGMELDSRADLYSFGVLVYEMLTGTQPFIAENPMQVLLKQIQEPPPPLTAFVGDLPTALNPVMIKALAKNPENRFQTAMDFADAFSAALHEGETGYRTPVRNDTARFATQRFNRNGNVEDPSATTILPPVIQKKRSPLLLIGAVVVVIMLLVAGALVLSGQVPADTAPTPTVRGAVNVTPVPNFGQLSFSTANTLGDTAAIRMNNVRPPASGQVYVAWLGNSADSTLLNIGRIAVDAAGNGAASFESPDGQMLPAFYNTLMISQEPVANERGTARSGEVLYRSAIPVEITKMLHEIFVESERGANGNSLLDTALIEAAFATQHAGLAANSSNIGGLRNHVEHTINILNGTEEDYDGNGRGQNPGAGIGLYPMLAAMDALVVSAAGVDGVTLRAQTEAESIRVCLNNVRAWADRLMKLEQTSLAAESIQSIVTEQTESTILVAQLTTGIDQNGINGIEPFEGECGLQQIPINGLLVATMEIIEGKTSGE